MRTRTPAPDEVTFECLVKYKEAVRFHPAPKEPPRPWMDYYLRATSLDIDAYFLRDRGELAAAEAAEKEVARLRAIGDEIWAAAQKRLSAKSLVARELRLARERDGLTAEELALACGTTRQNVSLWESSHSPHSPTALHVRAACDNGALRWALAAARAQVGPAATVAEAQPDELSHAARMSDLTRELTDVIRVYSAALAQNGVDARELAELRREMLEAYDVLGRALAGIVEPHA